MKNPVTHSVYEARHVQKKHQIRTILILCAVIAVLLGALLVIRVLTMKKEIDEIFPSDAAASGAMSEMTGSSEPSIEETSAAEETSADATAPGETGASDTASPSLPEEENVFIPDSPALQTVSHTDRDSAFHELQKNIQNLIDGQPGVRCGFHYINLTNGEEFGYNDMDPFTAAGAFNVAVNACLYDQVSAGTISLTETMALDASDITGGSGTLQSAAPGTEYTIRELSRLSIEEGDNTATAMILRRLGGIDAVNESLKLISDVIDFRTSITYKDFTGAQRSGKNRTSVTDLAKYTEYFYDRYVAEPETFQPLFNDLANTASDWGAGSGLPSDVLVCHKTGSIADFGCETDTAMIFAEESFVVTVSVECADQAAARALQKQLGNMVYAYIHDCYS